MPPHRSTPSAPPPRDASPAQSGPGRALPGGPEDETPWIVNWRRSRDPDVTLIAFPHAGGTAAMVRPWLPDLPVWVDLKAIQYPGRESRFAEAPLGHAEQLSDAIAEALASRMHGPVCFFGHSMGALLAFLVARKLAVRGGPVPAHLIVAGRRAPHLADPFEPARDLPEPEFIARLRRLNGTPAAVFEHPELLELLMPMLRADFSVSETYVHGDTTTAPCAITALGGLRDPMATPGELDGWREHAPAGFGMHLFEGEHFFIRSSQAAVLDRVQAIIARLRPGAGDEEKS